MQVYIGITAPLYAHVQLCSQAAGAFAPGASSMENGPAELQNHWASAVAIILQDRCVDHGQSHALVELVLPMLKTAMAMTKSAVSLPSSLSNPLSPSPSPLVG